MCGLSWSILSASHMSRERSTAYPILELASAVRIVREDLRNLGEEAMNREALARRLKYQSGSGGLAARKIGALVQYGQLTRSGGLYRLSLLAVRLQGIEEAEAEYRQIVQAAFERPPLFRRVLSRFRLEGRLPADFPRVLASDFGITEKASQEAAGVFVRSAQFAGVLNADGRFVPLAADSGTAGQVGESAHDSTTFTWHLPDLRAAALKVPLEVTAQDGELLESQLKAKAERLGELLGTSAVRATETVSDALSIRLYLANRRVAVLVVPMGLTSRGCDLLKEEIEFFCSNWRALLGVPEAESGALDRRPSHIGPRGVVR